MKEISLNEIVQSLDKASDCLREVEQSMQKYLVGISSKKLAIIDVKTLRILLKLARKTSRSIK